MFCGSATGQILPFYVIYKSVIVYQGWIVGLREDLQMQDIPVISLVGLPMTPLKTGSWKFFFQLPKTKRSQL